MESVDSVIGRLFQCSMSKESDLVPCSLMGRRGGGQGRGQDAQRDRLRPAGFEVPVSHPVLRRSEPHLSLFCC